MRVDPVQLFLEALGTHADGAEHAHAAGLGDGDDDVAAMREGEERKLDAEALAEGGLEHGASVARNARVRMGDVATPYSNG